MQRKHRRSARPVRERPEPREVLERKYRRVLRALFFYASPSTYMAIGFFPDRPCGELMEDFGETYAGRKPGARARKALGRGFEKFFMENDVEIK